MHRLKNIKYEMSTFLKVMGEFCEGYILPKKKKKQKPPEKNPTPQK